MTLTRDDLIAQKLLRIPEYYHAFFKKAWTQPKERAIAIKAHCLECTGYMRVEVQKCTAVLCPLWLCRPYQKAAGAEGEGEE